MQYEQGSPDAFAQAMLERTQDPSKIGKPKGLQVEFFAAALVALALAGIAYAIAS
jgi:hypothetical protein